MPEADRFAELRPFYQLCLLGLLLAAGNFTLMAWLFGGPLAGAVVLAGLLAAWRRMLRSQRREVDDRAARALAEERPRLKAKLDPLRARLRELSGAKAAQLVLLPDPAVVLETLSGGPTPKVGMSAGFWSTYAGSPRLVEAALAHEAGHVAARDVEAFQRMLSLMRTLLYALPIVSVLSQGISMALMLRGAGMSLTALSGLDAAALAGGVGLMLKTASFFTGMLVAGPALAVALAWSALLVAREIQADAFAAIALGGEAPVRELLQAQLRRRQEQGHARPLLRRAATWLIQPDLRWRATLPAARGEIGSRVELQLGVASGGFLLAGLGASFFVALQRGVSGQAVFVATVSAGVLLWLSWIAYALFWGRSRTAGGRSVPALLGGLGSVLRFSLAELATLASWGLLWRADEGRSIWAKAGPVVVAILVSRSFGLWAAGKLALCAGSERRRRQPALPRGLGALAVIAAGGGAIVVALVALLPRRLLSGEGSMFLLPGALFIASLLAGLIAHWRIPSPSELPPA